MNDFTDRDDRVPETLQRLREQIVDISTLDVSEEAHDALGRTITILDELEADLGFVRYADDLPPSRW